MVSETRLEPSCFIAPVFVVSGSGLKQPISSMPGVYRWSCDLASDYVRELKDSGIGMVLIFGIPEKGEKDEAASAALKKNGLIPRAIASIKKAVPQMTVATDVCLCGYTTHGHCGLIDSRGEIGNDETVELLSKIAEVHAEAGTDMVAPSDMMDGRVGAIRKKLDEKGFIDTGIMSYSVKYASSFYGPFRDAADSAPAFGDRRSHQMNPANIREALREVELDVREGADIVMVKPALAYLDVIAKVKERSNVPVAAYHVSGEYAMIKAAAANGWLDEERAMIESLTAIRRAGADLIITYFAQEIARLLRGVS